MTSPRHPRWRAGATLPLLLVLTTAMASGADPSPAPDDEAVLREWCVAQGGILVDRVATSGTNGDPAQWLTLAGRMTLCEFESGSGDEATRISADLRTMGATEPTLAGLAYLAAPEPVLPEQPSANPATINCDEGLGGTSQFGLDASGGGWVDLDQPVFVVMGLCVFADGSAIDEFGLLYHATGVIRGADLAPLMRYQPGSLAPVTSPWVRPLASRQP